MFPPRLLPLQQQRSTKSRLGALELLQASHLPLSRLKSSSSSPYPSRFTASHSSPFCSLRYSPNYTSSFSHHPSRAHTSPKVCLPSSPNTPSKSKSTTVRTWRSPPPEIRLPSLLSIHLTLNIFSLRLFLRPKPTASTSMATERSQNQASFRRLPSVLIARLRSRSTSPHRRRLTK